MRFEVLGPLRVVTGRESVAVTAARERVLLATLLLHLDQPVPVDLLVDAIWGDDPPVRARNQVQKCVSQLRARLGADVLLTEPAGYRISTRHASADLPEFRELAYQARAAASDGDQMGARDRYRTALALWRGPALADVDSDRVRRAAAALDEEWLRAQQECIEAELALGGGGELVAELTELVDSHPYQEDLHRALMLALFRSGRQADALAAYQRARQLLVAELGQEPGPALRELHQRVLSGDPTLLPASPAAALIATRRCLPRSVGDFTGRDADLARLADAGLHPGTVVAIDGMAGVGKTTLAVRAAHLLAARYPDAQLFVDLHGHSEHRPLAPATALDRLLRQLGVPAARIPADPEERTALWRSELATRRALVVLDNAAGAGQVAPLLPGDGAGLTLVTSRRRLVGLDAARPLSLTALAEDEAVALLAEIAGDRVRQDPEAALEVVRRCGRLPLAIRLVAARLAHRPSWTVRDLAGRLASGSLLDQLTAEGRTAVDVFALSYAPLHPDQQRVFRLLGLHPGEHFDDHAAAALADISLAEAGKALEELVDRHLLEERGSGRFRFHDLLREYAQKVALSTDSQADRRAATGRLLDYYLHAAAVAGAPIDPSHSRQIGLAAPLRPDLCLSPTKQGRIWLSMEHPNLTSVVRLARASRHYEHAWRIAYATWAFFYEGDYFDDLLETHCNGLAAAEALADGHATATTLNYLASGHYGLGEFEKAAEYLKRAVLVRQSLGDVENAAASRMNLAAVYTQLGHLQLAATMHQEVLSSHRGTNTPSRAANSLCNLGSINTLLGNYREARQQLCEGLAISRETGNTSAYIRSLGHLGKLRVTLGQHRLALYLLSSSLRAKRELGSRKGYAELLSDLAAAYRGLGQLDVALARHREALAEIAETGDRPTECLVRNEYGRTLLATGDPHGALIQHRTALAVAAKIQLKYERAKALDGIGCCLRETDPAAAGAHWREALALYTEMDVPERHVLARNLDELPTRNVRP